MKALLPRRIPVNVAYDRDLIRRIRKVAATNGERPADVVERLILEGIRQEEMQAVCNENARVT